MTFLGRKRELGALQAMYADNTKAFCLVYGRRRIGKSELIKESLRQNSIPHIYFECKETTETNNLASLSRLASTQFRIPGLNFSSIEELLEFLAQQAENKAFILVLDEYPYLRKLTKGLDSILQSLVDNRSPLCRLKIVVCGSFIDTMRSMMEVSAALFGRIDLVIHLKAMDYFDAARFYPTVPLEDKVRFYAVFGGIPYYNRLINPDLSFRENVIALLTSPNARLQHEIPICLRTEISKINNANAVFETLAKGYSRFSDILSQSHISSGPTLVDVLDKLISMELVAKKTPINDKRKKGNSKYLICDSLALFYYRYLFPNISPLNMMPEEIFWENYIGKSFETSYLPKLFEQICQEWLVRQSQAGRLERALEAIGQYWYDNPRDKKNGEFDIVSQDSCGYTFYEVKFRKEAITAEMVWREISQVDMSPLQCYRYAFFSRSGFNADVPRKASEKEILYFTLQDLYAEQ